MKLKNMKISRQLNLGLGFIILLVLLLGAIGLANSDRLWQNTKGIYDHPLISQLAIGRIQTDILNIRLEMKEMVTDDSEQQAQERIPAIDTYEADAYQQLDILYVSYLGPRSDIDDAYNAVAEYRTIRDETIRLLFAGNLIEAAQRVRMDGVGGIQVQKLMGELAKIYDFAKAKANQLYTDAQQQKNQNILQLLIILAAILLLSGAISIFLRKGILHPLKELTAATEAFRQGKLEVRSRYESANEFGLLSSAFNTMTETVQSEIQNQENLTKMSSSMFQLDDLHLFCQELLKTLLQYTESQVGAVYALNEGKDRFEHLESIGLSAENTVSFSVSEKEGTFGLALATGRIQHIKDLTAGREILTIPIRLGSETVSVIYIASDKSYSVSAVWLVNSLFNEMSARFNSVLASRQINNANIELELQKKQLDEASQHKSAFLSNMSHELRTPLNAIVGFSDLALKTSLDQRQYNYLSKIKISSHILLGLISDILDLSKIEAGKLELEIASFDLEEVLQNAVSQVRAKSQEKGLELAVSIAEDVPLSLRGDSLRLGQILLNLASNAVKFTDEGEIQIRVELLENMAAGALIQFSVKDTGIGLSEEQIDKLFQPFTQADASTTRKYGGTGMDGIEASKRIKRLFASGKAPVIILLTAYSSEGLQEKAEQIGLLEAVLYKPVTPSLLFNAIVHVCGKEGIEQINAGMDKQNHAEYLTQLRGARVLLVEDNEINREVAQEILQEAGLAVTIANNGMEAVAMVRANTYDIVLMDIQMPVMDGYDATREIRKDPIFAALPIIAMTANTLISDQEKCLQAGMNDHVAKPIDTNQLFQKMALWMKKKQGILPEKVKPELPPLAGIDVQAGLRRLGGNQKLYSKLLATFYTNYQHAANEIRTALDQGDLNAAEMLIHTLKGAAGNLGAQEVYLGASALEAEFRADRPDDAERLLSQFEQVLEQTFASISLMGKNVEENQISYPGAGDADTDASLLKPMLSKLENLLNDHDMDAAECAEKIFRRAKNTSFAAAAAKLKDDIDHYNFEGAGFILHEILERFGEIPEDGNR